MKDNSIKGGEKKKEKRIPLNKLKPLAFGYILVLVLLLLTTDNPSRSMAKLFLSPFSTPFAFGSLLHLSTLLILTGAGIIISFQAGDFNLGGEGQVYLGAFFAGIAALGLQGLPGLPGILLALAAGALGGLFLGFLSGVLKRLTSVEILISSYLLSGGVIGILNFLVAGPFRADESYLLSTPRIPENFILPRLVQGTDIHLLVLLVPLLPVLVWFYLYRTTGGYELRLQGMNREFAEYGGINTGPYDIWPIAMSGMLHGLAGAVLVLGSHFSVIQGGTGGLGWNGIGAALICSNQPLLLLPASFFLSYLLEGIEGATLFSKIPFETGFLIQGFIFILITGRRK